MIHTIGIKVILLYIEKSYKNYSLHNKSSSKSYRKKDAGHYSYKLGDIIKDKYKVKANCYY